VFGLGIELKGLVGDKQFGQTLYQDPVAVAREMVQALRSRGCHLVICLSHLGLSYESDRISDMKLATLVEGIDLIIGGHTHSFLDEPARVLNPAGKEVLINQVGWAGVNLGRLDYRFDPAGQVTGVSSRTLPVLSFV
jgi:5'-nucleotidase